MNHILYNIPKNDKIHYDILFITEIFYYKKVLHDLLNFIPEGRKCPNVSD